MQITQGDTAPALVLELQTFTNNRWTAVDPADLVGATARVVGVQGWPRVTVIDDTDATIDGSTVTHQWTAGETDTTGDIAVEVEVTYPGDRVQTFTIKDPVTVLPSLD